MASQHRTPRFSNAKHSFLAISRSTEAWLMNTLATEPGIATSRRMTV